MAALVVVEALAIALLGVLVLGLLRSHADILQELHRLGVDLGEGRREQSPGAGASVPLGAHRRAAAGAGRRPAGGAKAPDLVGTTPAQEAVRLSVEGARHDTLLAFLSSGCHTCSGLWRSLGEVSSLDLQRDTRLVVVTKGPAEESLSRIRELAPGDVPVVMSTQAWKDYEVPVTPYFVHVEGPSGEVVGQGSGSTWPQVISLLQQATADDEAARARPRRIGAAETETEVDAKLLAAGIRPGDPSLYAPPPPGT